MIGSHEQDAFAKFLVSEKGILSSDDLLACIQVQDTMRKLGIEKSLDKVIQEKGFLEDEQIDSLIKEFRGGDEDFIPGYRIVCKLGEGAMGEVYKAIDIENDNRIVALKVLFTHLGKRKATALRFLQEADICIKKFHHENIVKGYDAGYAGSQDCYYYVMEFVDGTNLKTAIQEKGVFEEDLAIKIIEQMASALEQAAKFNLVHRDIKPDNIMLTKENNSKLCDLGLARDWARDLSLTRTGAVMGTPFYISPEAASGSEELDSRSDIYSLGATAYHMVVGKVPFDGKSTIAVLYSHKSEPLIPPIDLRADLSPGLSAIIETMMAKSPDARYQTPTELRMDIKRLKEGESPLALVEKQTQQEMQSSMMANNTKGPLLTGGIKTQIPEILNIRDNKDNPKIKEDMSGVGEYKMEDSQETPSVPNKKQNILSKFLNSSEQRALSGAQYAQRKLLIIGGCIAGFIFLCIALVFYFAYRLMGN